MEKQGHQQRPLQFPVTHLHPVVLPQRVGKVAAISEKDMQITEHVFGKPFQTCNVRRVFAKHV